MSAALYIFVFLLFLIASFGVGFIINMLIKGKPWSSTVIAVGLSIYFLISMEVLVFKLLLVTPIIIGGVVATYTIRTLQARGFKMFG
ncbi:hypothetical protein OS242_17265 [Tumebacillus sp. DT12]|uniref:Uncharacterized protein n=1 Tax=Tumebacillus lacus TaxID=2995335 RepID=A0ABT3X485_9BACL|nr:hypothetical protein [Tumebacillus lacus]MCX7571695.1 hypothetical protein [Tumebacillus lacus]